MEARADSAVMGAAAALVDPQGLGAWMAIRVAKWDTEAPWAALGAAVPVEGPRAAARRVVASSAVVAMGVAVAVARVVVARVVAWEVSMVVATLVAALVAPWAVAVMAGVGMAV